MEFHRARLQRQFNKLPKLREGIYPEYGGNIEFELFSFFEICYHLKDWIKNNPNNKSPGHVEGFINNSPALRICADICNRLKHRTLEKRRSKSEIGVIKISSTISVSHDPSQARARLDKVTIETERGEECCFSLAEECMQEWERYFQENEPSTGSP